MTPGEMPAAALVRELAEELGIACDSNDLVPCGFAETGPQRGAGPALVLLLYRLARWQGEPQPLEGGAVGWFTPDEIAALPKPPLDVRHHARLVVELQAHDVPRARRTHRDGGTAARRGG